MIVVVKSKLLSKHLECYRGIHLAKMGPIGHVCADPLKTFREEERVRCLFRLHGVYSAAKANVLSDPLMCGGFVGGHAIRKIDGHSLSNVTAVVTAATSQWLPCCLTTSHALLPSVPSRYL